MKVLFVCTANSCRSQMAEAWARELFPAQWQVQSAGLLTYRITDKTRAVMNEVGLDLAGQKPKTFDKVDLDSFDLIITLSEEAGLYLPLPGWGERFGEQMAWSLGRLPRREARLELETLRERQVCVDPSRRFPLPHRPLGHRAALGAVVSA